jgi:selenide,water dikinase
VLGHVLKELPKQEDPNLLVDISTADDAGVYKVRDDLALVQTVDFFTPIVDDPYTYGQIAAANALSDVYAMGGIPLTAMNIVCFPPKLDPAVLVAILRGGQDKAQEAGVVVVGGHSVQDNELKYGMSVTGLVHPTKVVTNSTAQIGDLLLLTKPLGTGILTTALKMGKASEAVEEAVCASMTSLNEIAAEEMVSFGVHACTDITGCGLIGHAWEMAHGSGVGLQIRASTVPIFPETLFFAKKKMLTQGDVANREYVGNNYTLSKGITPEMASALFDPQTSGGLLIAIAPNKGTALLTRLHERGVEAAAIIGEVIDKPGQVMVLE